MGEVRLPGPKLEVLVRELICWSEYMADVLLFQFLRELVPTTMLTSDASALGNRGPGRDIRGHEAQTI